MANLRKALVVSVMSITVLSMSMLAVPFSVGAAAQAGDLIKMDGLSSVYYLGADGKRYVFPNESTYLSWYSDFSSVVTIPQSELESYDLGANVTVRPGTKLVKITTSPKVYAVEKGGNLVTIPSEAVAKALWGNEWATRVVDVADAFFTNYNVTGNEVSANSYPQGSLVKFGNDTVYMIDADGDARKVSGEEAFAANRFQSANVVSATISRPSTGATINEAEAGVSDTAQKGLEVSTSGSGLTVAVSSATAASDNIPVGATLSNGGAMLVPFTTFSFTAANDGDVVIEDITLTRVGLGDEDEIGDVYLYAGNARLTNGRSLSSDNDVTFGNINVTVAAGSSKEITVRANTVGGSDGMHAFEIKTASDVTTDASVSGSFPVEGNTMSFTKITTGSVEVDLSDVATTVTVGDDAEEVADIKITETSSKEDVALVALTLENNGTTDMDSLDNFVLYRKSVEIAADVTVDGDQVTFVLDTPYVIEEGENETFTVEADIVDGSDETIELEFDKMTDLVLVGQDYGFNVAVVATDNDVSATTIGNGDLTITEADSNPKTQDAAVEEDDVVFLVAELEAEEGMVSVEEIRVVVTTPSTGTTTLENMVLKLDGKIVAGPEDVTAGTSVTITFDEAFDVEGIQELSVEADFTDEAVDGDYSVVIAAAGTGIVAENSDGDAIDESGTATGNAVTIGSATPTLAEDKTLGDKTIVAGDSDFMVARFILEAGEAEDLEIENYTVVLSGALATNNLDMIDDLYINTEDEVAEPALSEDFAVTEVLEAGESKVITVYLTIDEDYTGSEVLTISLAVEAEGSISGTSLDVASTGGQTVTAGAGTLTLALGADTPDATAILAGAEEKAMELEFEATNTGYDVTEIEITVYSNSATSSIEMGNVTDITINGEEVSVINGVATVSDLDIRIDKDEEVTVEVFATTNDEFGPVTSGAELYFAITGYTMQADTDNNNTDVVVNNISTSNKLALYNTLLTVNSVAGETITLRTSGNKIMDLQVTADSADKATLKQFAVSLNLTDAGVGAVLATSSEAFQLFDSNGDEIDVTLANIAGGITTITLDDAETIAAGTTEVFEVRVNLVNVLVDDSCEIELLDTNFVWGDDEDAEGDLTGDLLEDLSGTFEISK